MSYSLLAFDTDRIKEYVFGTHRLREIRGASALLDRLNREEMPVLVKGVDNQARKIYANGGAGLFVVDKARSQKAQEAVQRRYRETTHTASITGVTVDLPSGWAEHNNIQPYMRQIGLRLRAAKSQNSLQRNLVTHPFLRPCDSCGELYSTELRDELGPGELLCASCNVKWNVDATIKQEIQQVIAGTKKPQPDRLWDRLISDLRQAGYPLGGRGRPEDFQTLGRQSTPPNYLGLIYADGDGMGKEVEKLKTLDQVERFSRAVDNSLYQAVCQAIQEYLQPQPNDEALPFDVLLLGGDDLVMVTTAQGAVQTALAIVEQFSALTNKAYDKPLSLSASVVLTHVTFPFSSMLDLAEDGLKFAKKEAVKRFRSSDAEPEGMLNFLVVNSPNHLDFKEYYDEILTSRNNDEILHRTLRPYTADDFRRLMQAARDLAEAPRSKLHQLREAALLGKQPAMLEGLTTLLRWRDRGRQRVVHQLMTDFADGKPVHFPWFQEGDDYYTPFVDLVELFDFLPEE